MSQRVKTSARGLVLPRSSSPENGHLRKKQASLWFKRTINHLWNSSVTKQEKRWMIPICEPYLFPRLFMVTRIRCDHRGTPMDRSNRLATFTYIQRPLWWYALCSCLQVTESDCDYIENCINVIANTLLPVMLLKYFVDYNIIYTFHLNISYEFMLSKQTRFS